MIFLLIVIYIAFIGTIVSSLCTPKALRILGTGKLVAYSIALTAIASIGYGLAESFNVLCLWPISLSIFVGFLLLCVLMLDYVTHSKLNKSYACERVFDILHQVSMESVKRERLKRKRNKKR